MEPSCAFKKYPVNATNWSCWHHIDEFIYSYFKFVEFGDYKLLYIT